MSTTVFVSGATGFVALHVVKAALDKGYSVIGTVRSEEKGEKIKKQLKSENFSYEIVKDIAAEGAFDEALKKHPEATVFLHTASPFHFKTTNVEEDLLIPAIHGTKNALKAIKAYGPQIKNVVVTSSYASVMDMNRETDPSFTLTEETWNPVTRDQATANGVVGYLASKKFAEEAAWDFVKNEKPNFTLSCINPSYVFGPQLFDEDAKGTLNTSAEILNNFLKLNKDDKIPGQFGGWVDVRDVGLAHIVAFEKKEAHNQRIILNTDRFDSQRILDVLHKNFPKLAASVPVGQPGSFDPSKYATIDNKKSKQILGFKQYDFETSVFDSVRQILANQ